MAEEGEEDYLSAKEEDPGSADANTQSSLSVSIQEKDMEIELGEGTTITGAELRSVLNKQLVYVSGGLEDGKHPILTFPEDSLTYLDYQDGFKQLRTVLLYFKSLTCFVDLSAGTTLLLDARNSKTHGPVKELLDRLASKKIPLVVHVIYCYIKTGFFGRYKPLASPEAAAKLQIKYLTDQKSLLDQLDGSNVTKDFGGSLHYDHSKWIDNRLKYEKIQRMHRNLIPRHPKLIKCLLECYELPKSTKDAERLRKVHTRQNESLTKRTKETILSVNKLVDSLESQEPSASAVKALDSKELIKLMLSLKLISQELEAKQTELSRVWQIHEAHMKYMTSVCHFNEKAEKARDSLKAYTVNINTEASQLGDTLESALEHGEKFEELVNSSKTKLDESLKKIHEDAQTLDDTTLVSEDEDKGKMHAAAQQAMDTVNAQVEELKKSYKELFDLCQQKREVCLVCVKFHMMTRQVQQWNQEVLEFLATLYLEDMSYEEAAENLSKMEDLHVDIEESQLDTIAELANSLPSEKPLFKKVAGNVKEKYEQTCGLLDVRKSHIMKKMAALSQPSDPPRVVQENGNATTGTNGVPPSTQQPSGQTIPEVITTDVESESKKGSKTKKPAEESTDGESDTNVLKKRQMIYKELLATEKVYVEDLKTVLHSYYDAMDPEESTSIPLRLRDKRNVVFGNLPEIHKFHESIFVEELQQYEDHPEKMGECFLKFTKEFQMYTFYCKTRNQSDALVNECTECQTFFKGIQLKLAHQLPLDAYLIKPVQRITKYQLLLKDMMKHCVKAKVAHSELKKALDGMLKVLKNLNDSLHVVGLKGFPGLLAEQGRLLVHDPFQLWVKSSASRSLFSRAHERHVFLFEKMIVFSKKTEVISQRKDKKSDSYRYKGHLTMAEIGMRKSIDGQPLQFELNLHGQQKVFKFQAQTKKVCDMWTSEIERLLEAQLVLMKDIVLKSGTLNRKTYKGRVRASILSRDSRFFGSPHETQSLHMPGRANVKRSRSILSSSSEASLNIGQSLPPNYHHSEKMRENGSDEEFDDESVTGVVMEHYETLAPDVPRHYVATSDYNPGDPDESGISLTENQKVEVIGINQYGWWWVRATNASSGEVEEGWVPASYLKSLAHTQA